MQNVNQHRILFFLGAGASKDAGVSTVVELVDDFKNILKNQPDNLLLESVEEILSFIRKWKGKRDDHRKTDIEQLLEAIEKIEDRDVNVLSAFFVDSRLSLTKYLELERKYESRKKFLSDVLKRSVAISTAKKDLDIEYLRPLLPYFRRPCWMQIASGLGILSLSYWYTQRYGLLYWRPLVLIDSILHLLALYF